MIPYAAWRWKKRLWKQAEVDLEADRLKRKANQLADETILERDDAIAEMLKKEAESFRARAIEREKELAALRLRASEEKRKIDEAKDLLALTAIMEGKK